MTKKIPVESSRILHYYLHEMENAQMLYERLKLVEIELLKGKAILREFLDKMENKDD